MPKSFMPLAKNFQKTSSGLTLQIYTVYTTTGPVVKLGVVAYIASVSLKVT